MTPRVLLDTGPLVASLNRKDRFHEWARMQCAEIAPPLFTCEPVLAESCFLLRDCSGGNKAVLELVHRGVLEVAFRLGDHVASIARLMAKYSSVPMSLADACLVRMSEMDAQAVVMTLDTDFLVYRRHARQAIPIIAPGNGGRPGGGKA